jgi:hypothetical protein
MVYGMSFLQEQTDCDKLAIVASNFWIYIVVALLGNLTTQ